jgi:hypothetical protein
LGGAPSLRPDVRITQHRGRQIEANRRNARKSTGPVTEEGKQQSRLNAVRHGLTAETVIGALEDAEDYTAFEAAIIADYDAQSAVERELVLRLASRDDEPVCDYLLETQDRAAVLLRCPDCQGRFCELPDGRP